LVHGPRVGHPVDHGRLRERVDGGLDDGAGLGVQPQPVLGDPGADVVPTREDGQAAVPVLEVLQVFAEAVPDPVKLSV
jgi:hypothetical protein